MNDKPESAKPQGGEQPRQPDAAADSAPAVETPPAQPEPTAQPAPPPPPAPAKRPPHTTKTWLAATVAGVLLLGGGAAGYFIGAANDNDRYGGPGWHDSDDWNGFRGDFPDHGGWDWRDR